MNAIGPRLSRRAALALSGALVVSFGLGGDSEANASPIPGSVPPDGSNLDGWLAIHENGRATLFTGKVEVGTGAETALAQIAAEELDFPIDRLDVVMGDTATTVNQGPTYGSRTIRYAGPQIRAAAAAGRLALMKLAARHFNVAESRLVTRDGSVSVAGASDRSVTYAVLVGGRRLDVKIGARGEAFGMVVAPGVRTKDPATYTVVGKPVARKDIPGKITARFTYIQDVKIPGMLHGRVVRPYGVGASLVSVDESMLKGVPGIVKLVRRENFLGVVATTEWAAIQAAAKLGSVLHPSGPTAGGAKWSDWKGLPVMADIWQTVRKVPGVEIPKVGVGSVESALGKAPKVVKATYLTPFQMHGSIGPSCAIADVGPDRAIFWAGTQMPHQARGDMARLLGIPAERIVLHWHEAAGAYGRNGLEHVIADAAIMSQAVGKPVRVQWMRWDEHGWEPKGPPIVQDLTGALGRSGEVSAWRHRMWVPTTGDTRLIAAALIGTPDRVGSVGHGWPAVTDEYRFPNAEVSCHGEGRVGLLTAWLRSPAQFETTFAMESFIDELAAAAGQDPLAFRLRHLTDPRAIAVLKAAAKAYGWESRPSRGRSTAAAGTGWRHGRGLAWVNRDDVRVATIADVAVDPVSGAIKVGRVVVAHDCGLVINPDGLRNQVEGNVIQSLSRTLHEEVAFDPAQVTSRDWISYPILRFKEVPDRIDVVLVNNDPKYPAYGAGEPSTCPTAAVIGNAVFDATGVRLRQTPFRPERVKAAMA